MITELPPAAGHDVAVKRDHGTFRILFKDLERPGDTFRDLGPNWFASVMGTGIVADAAACSCRPRHRSLSESRG